MAVSSNPSSPSKSLSLIDEHVSLDQCKKAVTALLKHVRAKQAEEDEMQLLPGKEQHVWLIMTVKRMQPHKTLKPQKIPLVHPLVDPRTTSVCLISKDPQREYKDLLESHNIKFISRVVGIEKLKGKFKGYDARRLLLRENGLFLADDRVLPLLPGLLGKEWFKAKKQPIPVSMTKKDLKGELEKAISSTYMHQNKGTCTSIKIANISDKDSQVLANLQAAIPAVVKRIHGGWDNVQNLLIKTSNSVSLPIWTCPLGSEEPGSRWAGMSVENGEWAGFVNEESEAVETDEEIKEAEAKEVLISQPAKVPGPAASSQGSAETTKRIKAGTGNKGPSSADTSSGRNSKKRTAEVEVDSQADRADDLKEKQKNLKRVKLNEANEAATIVPTPPSKTSESKKTKASRAPASTMTSEPVTIETAKPLKRSKKKPQATDESDPTPLIPVPTPATSAVETLKSPKRAKKKHRATEDSVPVRAPTSAVSVASQTAGPTLDRKELRKKKDVLGDTRIEKRKEKSKTLEKSARKGVKAQLIGKVKA